METVHGLAICASVILFAKAIETLRAISERKKNPILVSQLANMHAALLTEDCSMQMEIAFLLLLIFFVIVYHLLLK